MCHFFKATVAGFRGKVDGNEQQLVFQNDIINLRPYTCII